MKSKAASANESWRRLYAAADRIKELAPWTWMEETDIFGVRFPGTDETGYVSVMGMLGTHLAVSVYRGDQALHGFWDLEASPQNPANAERILEIPQLMASFEDRDQLEKDDRDMIRALGLKYRGRNAWPLFRSYRPGFYPWFLEEEEICKLATALEQTLDIAARFEKDNSLLDTTREDRVLMRTTGDGGETWEDDVGRLSAPAPITLTSSVDSADAERIRDLPADDFGVDIGFFLAPARVSEPGQRPSYAYMLMVVEPEGGFVLGFDLLQAPDGLPRMWEQLPSSLINVLIKAERRPSRIRVASPRLYQCLAPLCQNLNMGISLHEELPAVDDAKDSMWGFMTQ